MFRRGPKTDNKKSKPSERNKNDPDGFDPTQFGVQAIADDDPDLLAELAGDFLLYSNQHVSRVSSCCTACSLALTHCLRALLCTSLLAEMGWDEGLLHKPKAQAAAAPRSSSAAGGKQTTPGSKAGSAPKHDPDLLAMGIDLQGIGSGSDDDDDAMDLDDGNDDPSLLDELGELGGGFDDETPDSASSSPRAAASGSDAHADEAPPARALPMRAPSNPALLKIEDDVAARKARALALSKAGHKEEALAMMRDARELEHSLGVQRNLEAVHQIAEEPEVVTEDTTAPSPGPVPPALPQRPRSSVSSAAAADAAATATTADNASSADTCDAALAPTSPLQRESSLTKDYTDTAALTAEAQALKSTALALSREGRKAEAIAQLKRAKALEDQVDRVNAARTGGDSSARGDSPPRNRRLSRGGNSSQNSSINSSFASSTTAGDDAPQAQRRAVPAAPPVPTTDAFSGLEEALVVAMKAYMVRAKELIKSDRQAAAEETRRIKELQAHHARLKEVRTQY
jgi:tetratricopeptide (TPR) repeat protein